MSYSEDHIALAAEYALGTLDADERALVETMMIVDHGFMEMVEAWDRKLSALHEMVGTVEPPAYLWNSILAAIGPVASPSHETPTPPQETTAPPQKILSPQPLQETSPAPAMVAPLTPPSTASDAGIDAPVVDEAKATRSATFVQEIEAAFASVAARAKGSNETPSTETLPAALTIDSSPLEVAPVEIEAAAAAPPHDTPIPSADMEAEPPLSNVVALETRREGRVIFGTVMTAVAALLAGVIVLQAYRPELLPATLRVKPKIETVEIRTPAPPPSAQFVALLQQDAAAPAFILTVDTATKNFTVRKVGAAPQAGKSYELWLVSDKLQRPRSLGVIGSSDFTIRPALTVYDDDTISKATYAVTLEPEGGSPTGVATGPIVYSGKLVESVPATSPR